MFRKTKKLEKEILKLKDAVRELNSTVNVLSSRVLYNDEEFTVDVPYLNFGIDEEAKLPNRAKEGDCGYDAYALEDITIEPHTGAKVPLGIGLIIPEPFGVKAETRSGNHLKGLNIGSAWVDRGYRGQIHALIQNITDEPITIHKGDRPCAIELELTFKMDIVSLDEYCTYYNLNKDEVMTTERGASGYGSTGK